MNKNYMTENDKIELEKYNVEIEEIKKITENMTMKELGIFELQRLEKIKRDSLKITNAFPSKNINTPIEENMDKIADASMKENIKFKRK